MSKPLSAQDQKLMELGMCLQQYVQARDDLRKFVGQAEKEGHRLLVSDKHNGKISIVNMSDHYDKRCETCETVAEIKGAML